MFIFRQKANIIYMLSQIYMFRPKPDPNKLRKLGPDPHIFWKPDRTFLSKTGSRFDPQHSVLAGSANLHYCFGLYEKCTSVTPCNAELHRKKRCKHKVLIYLVIPFYYNYRILCILITIVYIRDRILKQEYVVIVCL